VTDISADSLPDDVLAYVDLFAEGVGSRGTPGDKPPPLGRVKVRRPLLYPARPDDLPAPVRRRTQQGMTQLVGFFAAAEPEPLPRGRTYGEVELKVTLPESCRVVAFPDDEPGSSGLYTSTFSQKLDAQNEPAPLVYAIVEAPRELADLTGRLECRAVVRRSIGRHVHLVQTVSESAVSFSERIRSSRAVRLVVSADIHAYSSRDAGGTARAQERLAKVWYQASQATGCEIEDQQEGGDSFMVVFPPGIDEHAVLSAFYAELVSGLRKVNLDLSADAAVRLRVGVDRGLTLRGGSGWVGHGPITAARLRDCAQARAVLKENDRVPFVLAVSESLYRDVFSERGQVPAPDSFVRAEVAMPEKGFATTAWIHSGSAG
jgi:hypothetical protein